jgi:hypothetical protein
MRIAVEIVSTHVHDVWIGLDGDVVPAEGRGICIASAKDRDQALCDAMHALQMAVHELAEQG